MKKLGKRTKVEKSASAVRRHAPTARVNKYAGTDLDFGPDDAVIEKTETPELSIVEHDEVEKKIVESTENGKKVFCVVSEQSGKGFGCYPSKKEAQQRLAQVEQFGDGSKSKDKSKDKKKTVQTEDKPAAKTTATKSLPELLTWQSVREQSIPDDGTSGLPESLEKDVPPRFRYWKCETRAESLRVHEALIKSELFNDDTVNEVDGDLRRVEIRYVEKMFLPPEYTESAPVIPPEVRPIEKAASILPDGDTPATLFDETITEAIGLESILKKCESLKTDFVIATKDTPEARNLIKGQIFKVWSHDDLIFTTNVDLEDHPSFEWVQKSRIDAVLEKAFEVGRKIRLVKSKEERIVFGVVLEPDEIDAQSDTISKEEIRQAAHKFMEEFRVSGIQHKEFVKDNRIAILESFIAPVSFEVDGQDVKEGTWLMTKRIKDDELWTAVKKGEFTGFSIGGSAIRKPSK